MGGAVCPFTTALAFIPGPARQFHLPSEWLSPHWGANAFDVLGTAVNSAFSPTVELPRLTFPKAVAMSERPSRSGCVPGALRRRGGEPG